jgi:hypothetical protein
MWWFGGVWNGLERWVLVVDVEVDNSIFVIVMVKFEFSWFF